jgi:8-oxo-dGTP pyrophosphatase MutT (NUDIX family)
VIIHWESIINSNNLIIGQPIGKILRKLEGRKAEMNNFEVIANKIKSYRPTYLPDDGSQRGAVLIPIYQKNDDYYIIFTKRTEELSTHKGQISFPGGKIEEQDKTLVACAIRETEEEIGIPPEKIAVLGELDQIKTTGSNILLSAYVSLVDYPFKIKINEKEVESIITVPLREIIDENKWKKEMIENNGQKCSYWIYPVNEEIIWGATAFLVRQLISIISE